MRLPQLRGKRCADVGKHVTTIHMCTCHNQYVYISQNIQEAYVNNTHIITQTFSDPPGGSWKVQATSPTARDSLSNECERVREWSESPSMHFSVCVCDAHACMRTCVSQCVRPCMHLCEWSYVSVCLSLPPSLPLHLSLPPSLSPPRQCLARTSASTRRAGQGERAHQSCPRESWANSRQ